MVCILSILSLPSRVYKGFWMALKKHEFQVSILAELMTFNPRLPYTVALELIQTFRRVASSSSYVPRLNTQAFHLACLGLNFLSVVLVI